MARVVLVTGVSGPLAARVAQTLSENPGVGRVIGADSSPPLAGVEGIEYQNVDLHDGSLDRIVAESGAELVLHLGLDATETSDRADGLLGTLRVLGAAQRSDTVRRLVVRSNAALNADDTAEVERHVHALRRRRPDLSVAVMRLANLIGPSVDTPLTRYMHSRVVPTVMGRDPRVQFLHEDDGAEALVRMALCEETGVFDACGADTVPLSHCLRRVGGQRLPVPARGLRALRGVARHGRIGYAGASAARSVEVGPHVSRLDPAPLCAALGWAPAYSSIEAFESYAHSRGRVARGAGLRPIHVLALARATFGR
ncbi:NAD-dependent epimerase/dehydratase family protein [Nocardiopsis alba]|nr:NAD-dependent epimerase/dehydratase family protein [Nocardiopsis alba]